MFKMTRANGSAMILAMLPPDLCSSRGKTHAKIGRSHTWRAGRAHDRRLFPKKPEDLEAEAWHRPRVANPAEATLMVTDMVAQRDDIGKR